jgi:GAF domain-containing protein
LTAFAQLGALRLNARRGLITLSSRDTEYILAEASRSISLQQDDDKEDRLWHGAGFLKKNRGLGSDLVKLFCNPETATSYVMINDLTKDDIFKDKCVVVGPPFVRALASVPLISPLNKMVIGAYTVVDDKPRGNLDEAQVQFMKDMSITIMDYLEAGRLKNKEYRAERMVKAIGLFIEGKETLREWWLEGGYRSHHATIKKRARKDIQLDVLGSKYFCSKLSHDWFKNAWELAFLFLRVFDVSFHE